MLATDITTDGIAVLRLDNEQRRNALSIAMRDAISDTLDQWATDDGVRVVVITGMGTAFWAGFDLKEFAEPDLARTIRDSSTHRRRRSAPPWSGERDCGRGPPRRRGDRDCSGDRRGAAGRARSHPALPDFQRRRHAVRRSSSNTTASSTRFCSGHSAKAPAQRPDRQP